MAMDTIQKARAFSNFDEAAAYILQLLSKQIGINSLFIARNDGTTNHIIKVRNSEKELVEEGSSMPLPHSFCSLSINHGPKALVIENISKNEMTRSMGISADYGQGTFVGVPVYYNDGTVYGTICGLDDQYYKLSEDQLYTFEMMSTLLTYVLELEKANHQIQTLTAPIVPVTKGVAIVPVIGEITAPRAQVIIEHVLEQCGKEPMEYLIIDVSGVLQINTVVGEYLLKLVNILKIIGVTPVITGIQPFMALKVPHFAAALKGVLIEANLESALKQLGFVLIKDCKEKSDSL